MKHGLKTTDKFFLNIPNVLATPSDLTSKLLGVSNIFGGTFGTHFDFDILKRYSFGFG